MHERVKVCMTIFLHYVWKGWYFQILPDWSLRNSKFFHLLWPVKVEFFTYLCWLLVILWYFWTFHFYRTAMTNCFRNSMFQNKNTWARYLKFFTKENVFDSKHCFSKALGSKDFEKLPRGQPFKDGLKISILISILISDSSVFVSPRIYWLNIDQNGN